MKKLGEIFGVIPEDAAALRTAGVHTAADLAGARDLAMLSAKSRVPLSVLWEYRELAIEQAGDAGQHQYHILAPTAVAVFLLALLSVWARSEGLSPTFDRAVAEYDRAGRSYREGRLDDAVAKLRRALALKADWADAHNNLRSRTAGER